MSSEYAISEDQIEFYQLNGYIQLFDVLTPAELEQIRSAFDEVNERGNDHRVRVGDENSTYEKIFIQKVNLWRDFESIKQYVLSLKIASIARRLSRRKRVRLWHDHALIKLPGDSRASDWHQDLPYWPMAETGALSCWMALDDVFIENGCMQFVPKSHSWGKFEPINLVDAQSIFDLVPEPEKKDFTPVPMPMPAGSCTFHNGLTFHYAGPNTTDKPRRAMITIYMPDGITFNGRPHVVTDPIHPIIGEPLTGDMFPVVSEG